MRKPTLLWVLILSALLPHLAIGQCRPDEILAYEDKKNWYCESKVDVAEQHAQSVAAIEEAAQTPTCTSGDVCNFFVAKIGESRNIPYFRDVKFPNKQSSGVGGPDEYRRANEIYNFIQRAVTSGGSGWKSVSASQAQRLADLGKFVVGVASNRDSSRSGHIAVVAPSSLPTRSQTKSVGGPWVRDAQSPNVSVEAGLNRFVNAELNPPIWAVWLE